MEFQSLCPILPSRDLAETRAFYDAVGFQTEGVFPDFGYMILRRDGAELHFCQSADLTPADNSHGGYLRCPEVESLSNHLISLDIPTEGIPRFRSAHDTPWGMRETWWVDPSGNFIRAGAFPQDG
ncbi:MAG: VOC family protein [Pseudomonadota bacterium]